MASRRAVTLLATVGTSLFYPNLSHKLSDRSDRLPDLEEAWAERDELAIARGLARLDPKDPLCGAEINSIACLIASSRVAPDCRIVFFHSDTDDGGRIGRVLSEYYRLNGHPQVEARRVEDLGDDPKRFRTRGLRGLAKGLCAAVRAFGPSACAIDATGGYKAQIAIAVLLGQAMRLPVYYKHERFSETIAFPPMPVSLDYELWMRASGLLEALARTSDPVPLDALDEAKEGFEDYEALVERVELDGREYVELSPVGQIFLETFRDRFRSDRDELLPPPAPAGAKQKPRWEAGGHMRSHPEVMDLMQRLTEEVPQVVSC